MSNNRFVVTINVDNAAFEPSVNFEVCSILRALADDVEAGRLDRPDYMASCFKTLRDINGNDVGSASYLRHDYK